MNKIDLPSAATMMDTVRDEVVGLLGCKDEEIIRASAKAGIGIEDILEAIVHRVPAPKGDPAASTPKTTEKASDTGAGEAANKAAETKSADAPTKAASATDEGEGVAKPEDKA